MVKVITGIRRCGKSTIMRQIIEEIKENGVDESHIIYVNFEDYKYRKISNADALYDYLRYITDACVCDKVPRYDIRGKKLLSFEEKSYVCDLGFFHLKKNRVKDEYNYIIETICYNELISRGYQVYIGKTYKGEVDFIATRGDEKIYVQAAYLLADDRGIEREFGAYRDIADNYPKYVVSMDKITTLRDGIKHINLIDFCMGER